MFNMGKFTDYVEILDSKRVPINSDEREKRIGKIPYYGATGQVGWIDNFLFDEELVLLGEDGAPFLDPYKNKAYLISGKTWVNNHAHVLKAKKGMINKFLLYWLNNINYHKYVGGTTRLKLNQSQMVEIPIPVLSLEEQSLIVSELEKQFTRLDESVESLKKVKQKLEIYRKSVLKAAFDGRLVEFDKITEDKLRNFVREINSGYACGRHSKSGAGILHFRPYNITSQGTISLDEVKKVDPHYSDKRLEYGDVVFNNTNSPIWVGKTCPYDKEEQVGFSNHMTRIKVKKELLDFRYLALYLQFLFLRGFYYKIMKNHVNQSSVNTEVLKEIIIKIPSLAIQKQIISEIESRFSVIEKLEETVDGALQKSEMLRKSILKSAFDGKLVE